MRVDTVFDKGSHQLSIAIFGRFNFSLVKDFHNAYDDPDHHVKQIVIDLRETEHMDSSALGMLLSMKKSMNMGDGEIRIINCRDHIRKMLKIAKFEKWFYIE